MDGCHSCGRPYDESFPDWTICLDCLYNEVPDDSYIDSLGIVWTPEDLEEAGGQGEVDKMAYEADVRNKGYAKN